MSPVDTGVGLPFEIVHALVGLRSVEVSEERRLISLVDLDGHESLKLGSLELGGDFFKTHDGHEGEISENFLQSDFESLSSVLVGKDEGILHLVSPLLLHSE